MCLVSSCGLLKILARRCEWFRNIARDCGTSRAGVVQCVALDGGPSSSDSKTAFMVTPSSCTAYRWLRKLLMNEGSSVLHKIFPGRSPWKPGLKSKH